MSWCSLRHLKGPASADEQEPRCDGGHVRCSQHEGHGNDPLVPCHGLRAGDMMTHHHATSWAGTTPPSSFTAGSARRTRPCRIGDRSLRQSYGACPDAGARARTPWRRPNGGSASRGQPVPPWVSPLPGVVTAPTLAHVDPTADAAGPVATGGRSEAVDPGKRVPGGDQLVKVHHGRNSFLSGIRTSFGRERASLRAALLSLATVTVRVRPPFSTVCVTASPRSSSDWRARARRGAGT